MFAARALLNDSTAGQALEGSASSWRKDRCAVIDFEGMTARRDPRGTVRPNCSHDSKPLVDHRAETPRPRIFDRSERGDETVLSKQRNRLLAFGQKAAVAQPYEEVQHGGGACEDLNRFQIRWNRVRTSL